MADPVFIAEVLHQLIGWVSRWIRGARCWNKRKQVERPEETIAEPIPQPRIERALPMPPSPSLHATSVSHAAREPRTSRTSNTSEDEFHFSHIEHLVVSMNGTFKLEFDSNESHF